MRKLLLLLFAASPLLASGPKNRFEDPRLNDEFTNTYKDIRYPTINYGSASSFTVTSLSISTLTATGQILAANGTVSLPSYSFVSSPTAGMYLPANTIGFVLGGGVVAQMTPLNGQILLGTKTNDSAGTGNIGEFISAYSAGVNSTGNGQYFDVVSISLTAGDWDISGTVSFNLSTAGTYILNDGGISVTSGNSGTGLIYGDNAMQTGLATSVFDTSITVASWRKSVSTNPTVYLKARQSYSSGTPNAYGRLSARRVR